MAKYGRTDVRDVLERASARETAARVAAGAIAKQLLARAGASITSHVFLLGEAALPAGTVVSFEQAAALPDDSPLRCVDADVERRMIAGIDRAKEAGDTMGGAFEVIVKGLPIGLGSYAQWDRKLDGRLAQALMSIPAIKAVGIGLGPEVAVRPGSRVHDEIVPDRTGLHATGVARPTNNAGGLEGGVTNGEDLRVSAWMKPISTLMKPLRSVDLTTMEASPAAIERSDVCAVPAAAVVGEAMVALVLADALVERFGGDAIADLERSLAASTEAVRGALPLSMIRPILRYGERPLHQPAADVTAFDEDLQRLIDDMIETMYAAPGIGLAATQVGVPLRVFVVDVASAATARPDRDGQSGVRRARRHAARGRGLPQRAGIQCHGRPAGAHGPQGARSARRRADGRGQGPARARVPARDGSPRRRGLRRSAARHQARPHRPEDSETEAQRPMVSQRGGSASSTSARRSSPCRRCGACSTPRAPSRGSHDVVALVSQPDRPKGRGHQLAPTPTKELALAAGIPVLQPERLKDEAFLDADRAR